MSGNHRIFFMNITILLLVMFISVCHGYILYRDSSNPIRPIKYHILNDPDRHTDRMKQYQNTVAQLRHWRRYSDGLKNDGLFGRYKSPRVHSNY